MEIVRTPNPAREAGRALTSALLRHKERPILLMLSGGSAFEMLAHVDIEALGPQLTLSVLDERYSHDVRVNNYAQLTATPFFKICMERGAQYISTEVTEETQEEVRVQWEVSLRVWKSVHQDGVVLGTMGVGQDGHTAGIFPQISEVDFGGESLVVAYTLPDGAHQYRERITTTFTFLTEWVDEAIVYAVGEEKREVLMQLEKGTETREEMPACVFHEMRSVKLFTDIDT